MQFADKTNTGNIGVCDVSDPIISIREWISTLSEPHAATCSLPTCPYAKRSMDEGRVKIIDGFIFNPEDTLRSIIATWGDDYDVVLLVTNINASTPRDAQAIVDLTNVQARLADLWIMVDHPDDPLIVDGHNNSQGEYIIFFVQRKSKLTEAANALRKTDYYKNWPIDHLSRFVVMRDGI